VKHSAVGIAALVAVALYTLDTAKLLQMPAQMTRLWMFSLGPLGIVGVLSISGRLRNASNSLAISITNAFGVVAFALWETVASVQSGSRILFREHIIAKAPNEATKELLRQVYQSVNAVQVTMDVAFDVFYCLAILMLAIPMFRDPQFGRPISVLGTSSAIGLLTLNLWTFPVPPADAGLVDLGPLTGAWWVLVIVMMFRAERRRRENGDAPTSGGAASSP
jgi:hypothetical protein